MNSKEIFKYHDGTQDRFGDPLAIDRAMIEALGADVTEVAKLARSESPVQAAQYTSKLIEAGRKAFGLAAHNSITNEGVADQTVLDAINGFYDWVEKKNLSTAPSPTSVSSAGSAAAS